MTATKTVEQQYEELGIFPDTWTCVAVLDKKDAQRYAFDLAASFTPIRISRDPDGKRWHVAVQGGLPKNPAAALVGLRGGPIGSVACTVSEGQHPQVGRE